MIKEATVQDIEEVLRQINEVYHVGNYKATYNLVVRAIMEKYLKQEKDLTFDTLSQVYVPSDIEATYINLRAHINELYIEMRLKTFN